jgi:lipase chaperone LimK
MVWRRVKRGAAMSLTIESVAEQLAISPSELWQRALHAFLKEQARSYNIERLRLCQKYGVSSLQEMDALVAEGKVDEETILLDFQRVDFLTAKLRQLDDLMVHS